MSDNATKRIATKDDAWGPFGDERESFFATPYRWRYAPLKNLCDVFGTLFVNFPRNVWRYRNWLARDADFDWDYLSEIMEIKLRHMNRHFSEHQIVEDADTIANETGETAEILHRLRNDRVYAYRNGYERYEAMSDEEQRAMWEAARAEEEADTRRLSELMLNIRTWWD